MSTRPAPACSCQGLIFLSHTAGLKSLSCHGKPYAPSYFTLAHQASRGCRVAAVTRPDLAVLPISLLFCSSSFSSLFYFLIIHVLHKLIKIVIMKENKFVHYTHSRTYLSNTPHGSVLHSFPGLQASTFLSRHEDRVNINSNVAFFHSMLYENLSFPTTKLYSIIKNSFE